MSYCDEGGTTWFLRLEAEFSNYDGKFRLPIVLTVGRPIFHSNCEGEMEVALDHCRAK